MIFSRHLRGLIGWHAGAVLVACLMPLVAWGQGARPEITFLIDSSSTMQLQPGSNELPVCGGEDMVTPDSRAFSKSRMMITKEVLAGSSRYTPWCIEQPDASRDANHTLGGDPTGVSHYRAMCCLYGNEGVCSEWKPCGNDHGAAGPLVTDWAGETGLKSDGVVNRYRQDVKFGLMTFDGAPSGRTIDGNDRPNDPYNFGPSVNVPAAIADSVGEQDDTGVALKSAHGERSPNLGIRNEAASFGGLVGANRWRLLGTPQRLEVNESAAQVRDHNRHIIERIHRIIPWGFSPVAPALSDAKAHFTQVIDDDDEALAACRERYAVLLTDGGSTSYYGGQSCLNDADCQGTGDAGACVCPCPAGADCAAAICEADEKICRYPEGFPYEKSTAYAEEMLHLGVPLFVVGLNLQGAELAHAREIAEHGSPEMGPEGTPGFFNVATADELRQAMDRVVNTALQETLSRTKPLIFSPTEGDRELVEDDAEAIKQWRLISFSRAPTSGDTARYGGVQSRVLGCPDGAQVDEETGHLTTMEIQRYDGRLEELLTRRSVSRNPTTGRNFSVLGGAGQSMYRSDGELDTAIDGGTADAMVDAANGVLGNLGALLTPVRSAGLVLNGFFGDRGWSDGQTVKRQLGEILEGDLVAVTAPNEGVNSPAYQAFLLANKDRPTLVATGAADGQVHLFRAADGQEMINLVPRLSWKRVRSAWAPADGPLVTRTVAECRTLSGGGSASCPADADDTAFRTLLVGGLGRGGANVFGMDVTNTRDLSRADPNAEQVDDNDFAGNANRPYIWDVTDTSVNDTNAQVAKLGEAVSRPALTHVRVGDQVKAAVIVGCGANSAETSRVVPDKNAVGRCVLVLDAVKGTLIKKIEHDDMDAAMTGDVGVYPSSGIAAAERAFIGDQSGRMWRLDLREEDPDNWKIDVAFPVAGEDTEFTLGREAIDAPSITTREDGRLVVVYGTGLFGDGLRSFVVSFSDGIDADANFEAEENWLLPLPSEEILTGKPETRDGITLFTTSRDLGDASCITKEGRLYGVHYFKAREDEFNIDGQTSNATPAIPVYGEDGAPQGEGALALILPPGRVAFGVTIATTPSCLEGVAASTNIVLNLSDESGGGKGPITPGTSKVERVQNGGVQAAPLTTQLFAKDGSSELAVCLDCDPNGVPNKSASSAGGPYPGVVSYWGSTFTQ